mmetsp:Transcript_5642/g.19109  ORF Transcript_5642/g.19109 Transcript_5642/m.19109 type:complete len:224 (-) Transcript_5642:203-874(-)
MVDGGLLLPPLHVLLLCQLRPRCQSGVVEDSLEGPAEGEATGNADGTDGIKSISVLHDTQRGGALLPPPPPAPCKLVLETHALHHLEHGTSPSLPVAVFLEEGAGGRRPGFLAPAVLPIPSAGFVRVSPRMRRVERGRGSGGLVEEAPAGAHLAALLPRSWFRYLCRAAGPRAPRSPGPLRAAPLPPQATAPGSSPAQRATSRVSCRCPRPSAVGAHKPPPGR